MNPDLERFIVAVLSNDEASTDDELTSHFIEQGVEPELAAQYIARREEYLNGTL